MSDDIFIMEFCLYARNEMLLSCAICHKYVAKIKRNFVSSKWEKLNDSVKSALMQRYSCARHILNQTLFLSLPKNFTRLVAKFDFFLQLCCAVRHRRYSRDK